MPHSLTPDPQAERLAADLLADDDTIETLLSETISTNSPRSKEAGRTVCGLDGEPLPPEDREARSVDLQTCPPRALTGIYHTHPTPDQLANPNHSLPDFANVAFEGVDASVIVGTETSSVLVAATDRAAMQDAFRNALGLDVTSTGEVVAALDERRIPSPVAARQRVRGVFGSLMRRQQTDTNVDTVTTDTLSAATTDDCVADPVACAHVARGHTADHGEIAAATVAANGSLRRQSRSAAGGLGTLISRFDAKDVVVGTLVGNLTSAFIESLFE